MEVLSFTDLPDGGAEIEIEMTTKERNFIKEQYGWKRLTHKRANSWITEVLEDYCDKILNE